MTEILTTVPDLKEMAISSIAVALLNHIDMRNLICRRYKNDFFGRYCLLEEVQILADELPIPKFQKHLVEICIQKVSLEIESWISYHYRTIFFYSGSHYDLYYHSSKLVWYPNGTINYKKTALNLQSSVRLTDLEKFRFLCIYCLKDEIERKWSLFSENEEFHCVQFSRRPNEYPLINYWDCYCKNKLHEIPLLEGLTIDSTMFRHSRVDNWLAKEYFFDRMSAEEQVQNAAWVINELRDASYQNYVLKKLTHCQRDHIYVNYAENILINCTNSWKHYGEILPTWFQLKDLINEEQFVSIIKALILVQDDYGSVVTEIWMSASDAFKHHLWNVDNDELLIKIWNCLKPTHDTVMLFITSANIRSKIGNKQVFHYCCVDLISADQLSMLEHVLNLCFPKHEDLAAFKLRFSQNETKLLGSRCQTLIVCNELSKFERLLNLCFYDVDNRARFLAYFTAEKFFIDHCCKLMTMLDFSNLERLLNVCVPTVEELMRFKQNFVIHKSFKSVCQTFIVDKAFLSLQHLLDFFFTQTEQQAQFKEHYVDDEFFIYCCKNLIIEVDISTLEKLLNFFFAKTEELTGYKLNFAKNEFFRNHCQKLITDEELPKLEALLNFMFTDLEELASFKGNLFASNICSRYYSTANLEGVNNFLEFFFSSCNDLIVEYKQKFLLSEDGFEACVALCARNLSKTVLNEVIADCLPGSTCDSINEFKEKIILLPASIAKFKNMILRNLLNEGIANSVDKIFTNDIVVRILKMLMFDNLDELIVAIFSDPAYKYIRIFQYSISWRTQDYQLVRECKRHISVDNIFQEILKKCVYKTTYNNGHLARCTLKKKFKFDVLDRFLRWYFESPKQIKKYKIQMMDKYQDFEMMGTLVRKCRRIWCWKRLAKWFFQHDFTELAKFMKKHNGEKIPNVVKF